MKMSELTLPVIAEDEAILEIRQHLKVSNPSVVHFSQLVREKLQKLNSPQRINSEAAEFVENRDVYNAALWRLVSRGILYLPITKPAKRSPDNKFYGPTFHLTEYGEEWLQNEDGIFNCLPTEYGRFSQFLQSYTEKFGDGYEARSREAVGCYKHRLYLSCCVMCGAAVESIVLKVRIKQSGENEEVVGNFIQDKGLDKVLGLSVYGKLPDGSEQVRNIRRLIKYWRDNSAHGKSNNLGEMEAFTALLVLLRLAHFIDQHWNKLTDS